MMECSTKTVVRGYGGCKQSRHCVRVANLSESRRRLPPRCGMVPLNHFHQPGERRPIAVHSRHPCSGNTRYEVVVTESGAYCRRGFRAANPGESENRGGTHI